jgi:hypothetical protein
MISEKAHRKIGAVEPMCWVLDAERLRHGGIWMWKCMRGRWRLKTVLLCCELFHETKSIKTGNLQTVFTH